MSKVSAFVVAIDRDRSYSNSLDSAFGGEGYIYEHFSDFATAEPLLTDPNCLGAVIGRNLEGTSGLQLAKLLRSEKETSKLVIILLAHTYDEYDVIESLDAGVDDYMGKPVSARELVCRFKAIQRGRSTSSPAKSLNDEVGPLILKSDNATAIVNGNVLKLTRSEFEILQRLVQSPDRVFSRAQLLSKLKSGGAGDDGSAGRSKSAEPERIIDVHIRRIRTELMKYTQSPVIQTVRGEGYYISEVRSYRSDDLNARGS
jgi:two-component system, OmpR family, phosphate regulon response regulator PhoB